MANEAASRQVVAPESHGHAPPSSLGPGFSDTTDPNNVNFYLKTMDKTAMDKLA